MGSIVEVALEIIHDVQKGIWRLLNAPADLYSEVPDQGRIVSIAQASSAHQNLYSEYLTDFQSAYKIADNWWLGCVDALISDGYPKDEALELAYENRMAGPASAPEVVWFVRTYWLSFDEINKALPPEARVPPQVALLGWLVDEKRDEYIRLLTCMPYWPIGLDENGNWC